MEKMSKELHGFAISLLILKYLNEEPCYAYKLIQKIQKASNEAIVCEEGYLYPLLKKYTLAGILVSDWRMSDVNQRRKYYNITVKGQLKLKKLQADMNLLATLFAQQAS